MVEAVRRRRKAERPTEILEAAFAAFSANGFAGTRVDDIAQRAGITKGTVYLYFDSKDDLFIAALKEMTRPLFDNISTLMREPQGSALDILEAHLDFVAEHMVEDRCGREVVRILMAEGSRFPEVVDRWHAEVIAPAMDAIGSVLRYGVARGEFRASAVEEFPQLVMAPVMQAVTWLCIFGERHPIDIRRYFRAAFDLMSKGLMAERPAR
jgi:AcrR family transcriptional regulator